MDGLEGCPMPRKTPATGKSAKQSDASSGNVGTDTGVTERWYTVRGAAKYLGVSQPTIFRWMKSGILSFYRIGGSTKFSLEGLDAVVEKTTGLKEAEAAAGRCASCGHGVLITGKLQGTGRLYFKPDRTRFWTFSDSMVGMTARVCAACGFVQLNVDTAKLHKLTPDDGA
jgi:excisionase family DNA binding protein